MRIDNVPARVKRSLTRAHKLCSNDFRFSGWHKPRERGGGGTGCVKVDKFYSVFLSSAVYIGGINSTLVFNGLVKGCVTFFIRRSRQEWQGQTPHFFFSLFCFFLFSRLLYLSVCCCCCCWIEQPNKSVAGICRRRGKKKNEERDLCVVTWSATWIYLIHASPFFSYSVEYRRYWKRKTVQCREKCLINKS
jgi:hypothetical protein